MLTPQPLGDYSGLNRDGVFVFKGINYALADRFQPSELETSTWSGLRDATVYGPQCLQVPGIMEQLLGESTQPMAEKCLTLNVFTADTSARKPVSSGFTEAPSRMEQVRFLGTTEAISCALATSSS